jgi:hypothetical protein
LMSWMENRNIVRQVLAPTLLALALGASACSGDGEPPQIDSCTTSQADGKRATLASMTSSTGGVDHGPSPNFESVRRYSPLRNPELLVAFAAARNEAVDSEEDQQLPSPDLGHLRLPAHISAYVCATEDGVLHLTDKVDKAVAEIRDSDFGSDLDMLYDLERPERIEEDPRADVTHYSVVEG